MAREEAETVTTGRAKRSTAGNRMRELLNKAQQEDEDELFKEVEGDEDFEAPQDVRDVFLDEFADTDEEVEMDEEEIERQMRREERRKAKGKSKAIYNPLAARPNSKPILSTSTTSKPAPLLSSLQSGAESLIIGTDSTSTPIPNAAAGPSTSHSTPTPSIPIHIDPSTMAPSTFVLAMRKQRREAKRQTINVARRSTMRASTLKTQIELEAKQEAERAEKKRLRDEGKGKGRKAQHEGGEVRGVRMYTQAELIEAALEEEERNKADLKDWLKREEEKRELRRVGRKVVVGPRVTWISRTVGRLVEEVEMGETEQEDVVQEEPVQDDPKPETQRETVNDGTPREGPLFVRSQERSETADDPTHTATIAETEGQPHAESSSRAYETDGDQVPVSIAPPTSGDIASGPEAVEATGDTELSATQSTGIDSSTAQTQMKSQTGEKTEVSTAFKPDPNHDSTSGTETTIPQTSTAKPASPAIAEPTPGSETHPVSTTILLGSSDGDIDSQAKDQGSSTADGTISVADPVSPGIAPVDPVQSSLSVPVASTIPLKSIPSIGSASAPSVTTFNTTSEIPKPDSTVEEVPPAAVVDKQNSDIPTHQNNTTQIEPAGSSQQPQGLTGVTKTPESIVPSTEAKASSKAEDEGKDIPPLITPTPAPTTATATATATGTAVPTDSETAREASPTSKKPTGPYTRNYIMLSQIRGGLPAEMKLVLGDHVEWDQVKYVPARLRPVHRKPTLCPFTGLPAKYRHPETMIPYAKMSGYKLIQELIDERYVWSAGLGVWMGGEEDVCADGMEGVVGWGEAVSGGWKGGRRIGGGEDEGEAEGEAREVEVEELDEEEVDADDGEEEEEEGGNVEEEGEEDVKVEEDEDVEEEQGEVDEDEDEIVKAEKSKTAKTPKTKGKSKAKGKLKAETKAKSKAKVTSEAKAKAKAKAKTSAKPKAGAKAGKSVKRKRESLADGSAAGTPAASDKKAKKGKA